MMFNNMFGMTYFWIFGILILVLLATFVASDANKFGQNGFLWALLVIFMPMIGILVYVIMRSTWTVSQDSGYNLTYNRSAQTVPPRSERINQRYTAGQTAQTIKEGIDSDVQYCTSCGFENRLDATFCKNCGTKISK